MHSHKTKKNYEIMGPNRNNAYFLQDYLCDMYCPKPFQYEYESWVMNDFQLKVYKWKFDIEHLSLVEEQFADDLEHLFIPQNKYPRDNNLYLYNGTLFSSEPLPDNIKMCLSLGKYRANSFINICKKEYSSIFGHKDTFMIVDMCVKSFELNGSKYYYINYDEDSPREIDRIDYEKN